MGSAERKNRIKDATRRGILDASRTIARQEGWSALTIRKVAEIIEYSPSMIYEYFPSKDAILLALLQEGFAILGAAMARDAARARDAEQRIHRLAAAYANFATEHPELYQVMNGTAGMDLSAEVRSQAAAEICLTVETALVAWADSESITLADPREDAEIAWSLLHGIVSLTGADRLASEKHQSRKLLERAVNVLLAGWKA